MPLDIGTANCMKLFSVLFKGAVNCRDFIVSLVMHEMWVVHLWNGTNGRNRGTRKDLCPCHLAHPSSYMSCTWDQTRAPVVRNWQLIARALAQLVKLFWKNFVSEWACILSAVMISQHPSRPIICTSGSMEGWIICGNRSYRWVLSNFALKFLRV